MTVDGTTTAGVIVACQNCRAKLGEVFFLPGAARFFGCPKCGKDVVTTAIATPFGIQISTSKPEK